MRFADITSNDGILPAVNNAPYGNDPKEDDPKIYLTDPSQLSILPDGEYDTLHRPLATSQSIPLRGTVSHGVDNDVATSEYDPVEHEHSRQVQTIEQYGTVDVVAPIPVSIVNDPLRGVRRTTSIITPLSVSESYTGALGVLASVRRVLPYNDSRTHVTVILSGIPYANSKAMYAYWVGVDPENADSGVILSPNTSAQRFDILGKNAIYAGLVPLIAFDGSPNNARLTLVVETEGILFTDDDHKPRSE